MTCPGTERVFVNPAVCQLASARRHKPLSAASPLTRHWALSWSGWPPLTSALGLRLLPTPPAAASCRVAQAELCWQCDRRGLKEGCENQGPHWAREAPSILVPVTAVGVSLIIREMGITAMASPLDEYEIRCVNMYKPAGSTQEI